jgi:hypothetical protein
VSYIKAEKILPQDSAKSITPRAGVRPGSCASQVDIAGLRSIIAVRELEFV